MTEKQKSLFGTIAFVVLIVYTIGLTVLAVDQLFGLGLWPPKLDRILMKDINDLGDSSISAEKRDAIAKEIVSYHEFSVPLLIKAIEKNKPGVREPATRCLQEIAKTFFNSDITPLNSDVPKLRQWWQEQKKALEAPAPS